MIGSDTEYELTQSKLKNVRETMTSLEGRSEPGSGRVRAASLRSLKAYANQLVEELIRYEIAHRIEPRTQQRAAHSAIR